MSKKNTKQAKFFCENCGSEVPENSKFCKKCGKFFSAVRCPNCGNTGRSSDFKNGCPECGYAVDQNGNVKDIPSKNSSAVTANNARALAAILGSAKAGMENRYAKNENALPVWIYVSTTVVLAAVLFAVYSCIRSPV